MWVCRLVFQFYKTVLVFKTVKKKIRGHIKKHIQKHENVTLIAFIQKTVSAQLHMLGAFLALVGLAGFSAASAAAGEARTGLAAWQG